MYKKLYVIVLVAALGAPSQTLNCFENAGPFMLETNKSAWKFCAVIEAADGTGVGHYGLGPGMDNIQLYSGLFKAVTVGPIEYAVIGNCILEKYTDFLHGTEELKIRCFCNTDGCNKADNTREFFKKLQ